MKRTAIACVLSVACVTSAAALPLGLRLAARAAANAQRAETPEERAYRIYAPCSAFEVTVTSGATFSVNIERLSGHDSVTVDWGDGTTSTHTSSPASHAYAADGSFVVQLSDDVYRFTFPADSHNFVSAALRWGDSLISTSSTYSQYGYGGKSISGFVPRWGASVIYASNTYRSNFKLTGSIPPWGDKITNAEVTYFQCSGLTGDIPAWGDKITSATFIYQQCSGLTGAWTDDPALLMPTNITSHAYVVLYASSALRALFYSDWGGTRTKEE